MNVCNDLSNVGSRRMKLMVRKKLITRTRIM